MSQFPINPAELVLNSDGSVYHLHLKPEHIAENVILVGDQDRVGRISRHFDKIEHKIQNREFVTHTGYYKSCRISAISTGIGTDNIDIVMNELDAAVNVNLKSRTLKKDRRSLNLIRIGTSGSIQADIPVGSFLLSEFGLGFDGLIYYYKHQFNQKEKQLADKINDHMHWPSELAKPYIIEASSKLVSALEGEMIKGITATATGFYGPQGRSIYLENALPDINKHLTSFQFQEHRITNFEMETSALFGLGKQMGHHCATCCAIIANRISNQYAENYKLIVDDLIQVVLDRIVLL